MKDEYNRSHEFFSDGSIDPEIQAARIRHENDQLRVKTLANIAHLNTADMMDIATANKIRDLFGPCTALYECWNAQDIVNDFNSMVEEEPATTIGYWLGIQLSVEDAFGTHSELRKEVGDRLRPYWTVTRELSNRVESHTSVKEQS
jgi:hypothetical protein